MVTSFQGFLVVAQQTGILPDSGFLACLTVGLTHQTVHTGSHILPSVLKVPNPAPCTYPRPSAPNCP